MFRDTRNMMVSAVAATIAEKAELPEPLATSFRQKIDAMRWAFSRAGDLDTANTTDPHAVAQELERVEALVKLGERGYAEALLARERVSEREAARRYVASLSPAALKTRREMVRRYWDAPVPERPKS